MKELFKKLTITQTIIFLSTFLFSLQAIYGLIINSNLNTMGHHITQIESQYIPITKKITLLTEHQLKQEVVFERAFRYALELKHSDSALQHFIQAKDKFQLLSNTISTEIKDILNELTHDISATDNEQTKTQFTAISQELKQIETLHKQWDDDIHQIFQLLENDDASGASSRAGQVEEYATELEESVVGVLAEIEIYTEEAIHQLNEEEQGVLLVGIIMLSISLIMAIILTKLVTHNFKVDLDELKIAITRISEGDLLTKVSSKLGKEFGLNTMRKQLHSTLLLVQQGVKDMDKASDGLAEVTKQVLDNINQQAEEVNLVSVAMTEMEATSMEVARHAESTQSSTMLASQKADESRDITDKAMASMSNLTTSLDESSQNIQELDQHSSNISSVLTVIKGIADQTNLLALNAAIEAARAGEQGRGFAVVADEVRTLAQRTQDSTIEIEEMVNLFTDGTSQAVRSMEVNAKHGNDSHQATLDSNHKIEDIQAAMQDINNMNSQIATAAEEQACTSQELSKNTVMISKLSAENIEAFARVSASSEELTTLAKTLKDKIEKFQLA